MNKIDLEKAVRINDRIRVIINEITEKEVINYFLSLDITVIICTFNDEIIGIKVEKFLRRFNERFGNGALNENN